MTTPDPLKLFTFAQLAELWEIGEKWLRQGVSAGVLPHHRIAGQIKFTRDDAAKILALHAKGPAHIPTRDEVAARRADVARTDRSAA